MSTGTFVAATVPGAVHCQTLNVAPDQSPNDVTRAIGRLISRDESLRTLFAAGPSGERTQQLTALGELLIDVHELGVSCPAVSSRSRSRLSAASRIGSSLDRWADQ